MRVGDQAQLRIVHITDTHIVAEPGAEVYGVDSFAALESLLAVMQRDPWTPHLLIATSDLSEDGSAASYQRLRRLFMSLGLPVYCIPGNHDRLAEMHAHLKGGPIHLARRVGWEPWHSIWRPMQSTQTHVVIEEAQAIPGQGTRGMFPIGMGFGVWLGLMATLGLAYTRVRPGSVEEGPRTGSSASVGPLVAAPGGVVQATCVTPRER